MDKISIQSKKMRYTINTLRIGKTKIKNLEKLDHYLLMEIYKYLGCILESPEINNTIKEAENLEVKDHSLGLDIV